MAITLVPITDLPQPPLKTDPANFAERADTFLDALPDFVTETNAAITELNKITSGLDQTTPIAAWLVGTTYDFPDVVAGSDGYSYRCVDTAVVGVNPTTDDGTNWRKLTPSIAFASEAEVLAGTVTDKAIAPDTLGAKVGALTGAVMAFAANSAPTGWLKCNGAEINRTTYAGLFATIGVTHGAGDGSTTFNLPDLRGEFVRGWDDARGVDSARVFGSAQGSANLSHNHSYVRASFGSGINLQTGSGSLQPQTSTTSTVNTGSSGETESRPRNVALLYCIKY